LDRAATVQHNGRTSRLALPGCCGEKSSTRLLLYVGIYHF
jgi:hypothetical protein